MDTGKTMAKKEALALALEVKNQEIKNAVEKEEPRVNIGSWNHEGTQLMYHSGFDSLKSKSSCCFIFIFTLLYLDFVWFFSLDLRA